MYANYLVLFAILFTGYFLRKIRFLDDAMNHGLNKFIVYFAYPCMIVHNLGTLEMDEEVIVDFLLMLLLTLACFFAYGGWVYLYCKFRKVPRDVSNIVELSSLSPNNGFMGFPITLIFFGERGFLFMLAHNAAMNFFVFTYGTHVLRRNKDAIRRRTPRLIFRSFLKVLFNPNVIALIIGFLISALHWTMPEAIDEYLVYIGNVSTPMAMIYIGSTLAGCSMLEILKDHIVIEGTLNKLIILPLLTYALVILLPVDPLIKAMLILGCCFPAAATISMLAEQEGENETMASKILFLSTVLSIITIPLSIKMINLIVM